MASINITAEKQVFNYHYLQQQKAAEKAGRGLFRSKWWKATVDERSKD